MENDNDPNWSEEEKRLLHHERFVAAVLEQRKPRESEQPSNPAWQRFLESAGGAALVTVLLGSVAAGIINSLVQEKLKERELALTSYQEELKQQQDIATRIVDLVGTSVGAAEDLILLTSEEFNPNLFTGEQKKKMIDQRTQIRETYNRTDTQWRTDQEKLALLIGLHSHIRPGVTEAWRQAQQSVTAYKDCAEEWYSTHLAEFVTSEDARSACSKEKIAVRTQLEKFSELMQKGSTGALLIPSAPK
jgi:hypothetical protein